MQSKIKNTLKKNLFENNAWRNNLYTCGIDEVGRGCLAGPLVTAAAILPKNANFELLKDSKILSKKNRGKAFEWIKKNCIYSIAISSHHIIDKNNIYQATLQTMKKSLLGILQKINPINIKYVLIDAMPLNLSTLDCYKNIDIKYFNKGEKYSTSIAAASIVAKVTRDKLMEKINHIFPQFYFDQNKGYGTKNHVESLLQNGPNIIHRKTFISKIWRQNDQGGKQETLF